MAGPHGSGANHHSRRALDSSPRNEQMTAQNSAPVDASLIPCQCEDQRCLDPRVQGPCGRCHSLTTALDDKDDPVRRAAIYALARIGPAAAAAIDGLTLTQSDETVTTYPGRRGGCRSG